MAYGKVLSTGNANVITSTDMNQRRNQAGMSYTDDQIEKST